ncbi:MAG: protein kinase, partial [Planctomycetes bacterium]|nr:protein kinase [Planctomycetota bacterium]
DQARRRMAREVVYLRTLHQAGAKVPQVIDDNTQQFENLSHRLFFVMDLIKGDELARVVTDAGGLSLESSLAIARDLCQTIEIGIAEGIHHRDLKPENIILRSLEPPDVVIVDYGLSFNEEEETQLTKHSETIESPFLTLPERRIPGGDRRDPRSDLAAICGVLYYCITAQPPALLQPAPHRRSGGSVRQKVKDKAQAEALEALLDRGLAPELDDRFQTVGALIGRLEGVAKPRAEKPRMSPSDFAKQLGRDILKSDRTSQLSRFAECAKPVIDAITMEFRSWRHKIDPFEVTPNSEAYKLQAPIKDPPDVDAVAVPSYRVDLKHKARPFIRAFVYKVFASGTECGLFRVSLGATTTNPRETTFAQVGEWENVCWWNGLAVPDKQIAIDDFQASLNSAMDVLRDAIVQRL